MITKTEEVTNIPAITNGQPTKTNDRESSPEPSTINTHRRKRNGTRSR